MKKHQELPLFALFMLVHVIAVAQSFNSELIMERCKSGVVYIESGEGLGSGFLIHEEGWVVTNYHVVEERSGKDFAEFADGDRYRFTVHAYDEDIDLALLKLRSFSKAEAQPLPVFDKGLAGTGGDVATIGSAARLFRPVELVFNATGRFGQAYRQLSLAAELGLVFRFGIGKW